MKKVIFSLVAIISLGLVATKTNAQTASLKIGYFDADGFVQRTPEFNTNIKPKLTQFQTDSIGAKRDQLDTLFTNLQNTYKNDSLAKKSNSILNYDRQQLQSVYYQVANWQNLAQNAYQQKYGQLCKPIYDKVMASYKKVVGENKVGLVLRPDAILDIPDPKSIVDIGDLIAKDLGIKLLDMSQLQQNDNSGQ